MRLSATARAVACVLFVFLVGFCSPLVAQAPPITQQQADAILKELREIRKLLEQMVKTPAARPAQPVAPTKVKLSLGDGYSLGRADAPVTLVEYTDYQCPYCRRFHESAFQELKKNYIETGKLRFISRDLPLSFHANAFRAAQAARCAGDQGKFWEMRDILISNADKLGPEALSKYAGELLLDTAAFEVCVASDKHKAAVEKDVAEANGLGLTGTPSFVVGRTSENFDGIKLVGAQPFSTFEARIKELLPAN